MAQMDILKRDIDRARIRRDKAERNRRLNEQKAESLERQAQSYRNLAKRYEDDIMTENWYISQWQREIDFIEAERARTKTEENIVI